MSLSDLPEGRPSAALMAQAEIERRKRIRQAGLMNLVPMLTPGYLRPEPLAPIVSVLEQAVRRPIRKLSSVPPQTGKTTLIEHGFIHYMLRFPRRRHAYVTYQQTQASKVGKEVFQLAQRAGLRPEGARNQWYLPEGGSLTCRGIDTGLTGLPVDGLLVFDDPHKNRAEAESFIIRERIYREFSAAVLTRLHPTAAVLVNHTRWHVDDLIGRLLNPPHTKRWAPRINLRAINDAGEPLWPALHPLWQLEEAREGNEYDWWSLYMGEPRPPGGRVFRDVVFYEERPKAYKIAIGIDLAYTAKQTSDWCVALVMAVDEQGIYYILDVVRMQADPPTFAAQLRMLKVAYPGAQMLWGQASAAERGMADLMRELSDLPLRGELAESDKLVKARSVATKWNAGKVRVPHDAPWLAAFIGEVINFTGMPGSDRHDDQVDALGNAFDCLHGAQAGHPVVLQTGFTNFGGKPLAGAQPPTDIDPEKAKGTGGLSFR
jgi:predicted phage terminase large subunit-like protein